MRSVRACCSATSSRPFDSAPPKSHNLHKLAPLRIAQIYALVSTAWIIFSDIMLDTYISLAASHHYHVQTINGYLFVVVTPAILYRLIQPTESAFLRTEALRRESESRLQRF